MKILVVGAAKPPAIERYFVRHLEELGEEVRHYAAQNVFFDYYNQRIWHKLAFKAGFSPIYRKINEEFREQVNAFRPQLIWVFKGMEIFASSLEWARAKGIRLVNYNTDNPFLFSGKGSGNQNVTDGLPLYDLHLTYDRDIRERIVKEYGIRCELLPFGFEENAELYEACTRQEEECSACFVGSPDKDRVAFLEQIAAEIPVTLYGAWEGTAMKGMFTVNPAVHGTDFWKTLYRFRVQLNYMRPHNPASHNMRSFEVPGIGGIMLAPATVDHKAYFKTDEEIFLYSDPQECLAKAKYLLGMAKEQADEIRRKVRTRSLVSGYSYQARARQALDWFESIV
jgi:spore maturation protein CgeB